MIPKPGTYYPYESIGANFEIGQAGETSQRLKEMGFYTSVKTDFMIPMLKR